jgi:hypothetical protein
MRRALIVAVLLFAAVWQSGCYTAHANLPGALRTDLEDEQVVITDRFAHEHSQLFLFYGLVGETPDDVFSSALDEAALRAGADGAANVVFHAGFTPMDYIISTISFGLVVSRTYRLEADLVRLRAPALPGRQRRPRTREREEAR